MLYNRQPLPLLKIKKVSVFRNNKFSYGIDLSLTRVSGATVDQFKTQASKITDRLKIVLVILHSGTENYLSGFQSDALRHRTLTEFKKYNKHFVKEVSFSDFINKSSTEVLRASQTTEEIQEYHTTEIIELPALNKSQELSISKVHLLSFMVIQETDRLPARYIYTKDANLEYELLLEKQTDNLLLPPPKRKSFYAKSTLDPKRMIPYVGPAHYHGPKNPGPNGYIGWMAGHARGNMGPMLQIREVENYKIVVEDDFYSYKSKIEQPEIPKSYSVFSQGSDLRKHIRKDINFSKNFLKSEVMAKALSASKSSLERDNKSFFLGYGNNTLHISSLTSFEESAPNRSEIKHNNYYGSIFGVDVLSMIRYRSEYGPLITHHYNKSNMDIINQALNYSHIHKMEIKRKRISNTADSKTSKGTREYSEFSKGEKRIVSSQDRKSYSSFKGTLRRFRSLDGELQEVVLSGMTASGQVFDHPDCRYARHFFFKDFDLFHNVEEGVHTFEVSLELVDGMKTMLERKYNNFKNIKQLFEKFATRANILQIAAKKSSKEKSNFNSFLKNNKNLSIAHRAAREYFEIQRLISGDSASKERIKSLENSISPKNIDIGAINNFLNNLSILESSFARMLKIKDVNKIGKKSSSNLTGTARGNIVENFKTGIRAEAFPPSKLIADFSIANPRSPVIPVGNLFKALSRNKSTIYKSSFIPIDLKTIQGQKYKLIDEFSSRPGNQKITTDFKSDTVALASELGSGTSIAQANKKFMVAVLEQPGAEKRSLLNKGDIFYSHEAQQIGKGVKLKINGLDIASSGDVEQTSEGRSTTPTISANVQKSIFNVSKKIEDKDTTLKEIEKEYKNIYNIRSKIGPIYDGLSSAIQMGDKIVTSSTFDKIYESKYKGKTFGLLSTTTSSSSMIDEYSAKLSVHLPGIYEQEIDINKITNLRNIQSQSNTKRYILMKLEGVFSKNVLFSNNLFFAEV